MLFDLLHIDSLDGIRLQHSVNEVFHVRGDVIRHKVFPLLDLVEKSRHAFIVEGKTSADHCIKNHSERPNVYLNSTIGPTANDFRCRIVWRTTCGFEGL